MEMLVDALQCWWRNKEIVAYKLPTTPPPSPGKPSKPLVDFSCCTCFKFGEEEDSLMKRAKIGKKIFVFCDEDCYNEWLSSPGTMY